MDSMQKIYKRERTGFRPIDVSSFPLYHPFYKCFLLGIASQGVINDHLNSTIGIVADAKVVLYAIVM